jgi:hypothetical protein
MNKYASEVNELYNASVNQCFRIVTEILSVGCLLGHLGDCLGFCWLVSHIYIYIYIYIFGGSLVAFLVISLAICLILLFLWFAGSPGT